MGTQSPNDSVPRYVLQATYPAAREGCKGFVYQGNETEVSATLEVIKTPLIFFFFLITVNVVSDSKILDKFQAAYYIFFLTKMFQAGSFAYELLAEQC